MSKTLASAVEGKHARSRSSSRRRPTSSRVPISQILRSLLALTATLILVRNVPAQAGAWSDTYDWATQMNYPPGAYDPTCGGPYEISHAALIPTGLYKGMVLMFRQQILQPCNSTNTTEAWIFDPNNPRTLLRVEQDLDSNVFCAGQSWDKNGELLVVGGNPAPVPFACYRFRPLALLGTHPDPVSGYPIVGYDPGYPPWIRVGDMIIARYYPAVGPLNDDLMYYSGGAVIDRGGSIVLGGPANPGATQPNKAGNEIWEILPGRPPSGPKTPTWYPPLIADIAVSTPYPHFTDYVAGSSYDVYTRHGSPLPEVLLDSYPRFMQTSLGDILIQGDVNTDTPGSTLPGLAWVVKPRLSNLPPPAQPDWQLWRGIAPHQIGQDPSNDGFYNTGVFMHRYDSNGFYVTDRFIVMGGSQNLDHYLPGWNWQVNEKVWEFMKAPSSEPIPDGTWSQKTTDAVFKRLFGNATMLGTGDIFVDGGTSTDDYGAHGKDPQTGLNMKNASTPVLAPILYDPADPSSQGPFSTQPQNSSGTPRLYHHTSVLLPDGRVVVCGGKRAQLEQKNTSLPAPINPIYPDSRFSGEVFSPPYMSAGFRPIILSAPNGVTFSTSSTQVMFDVDVTHQLGNAIDRVALIRCAALTHHFDGDQRYIELEFTSTPIPSSDPPIDQLHVIAPTGRIAPAGWYMLFAVENAGATRVPSVGAFLKLSH